MPLMQISYGVEQYLPGAVRQGTRRATRRLCALTSALASLARGEQVSIQGVTDIVTALVAEFATNGVPADRAALWAETINGAKAELDLPECINDLYLSGYQVDAMRTLGKAGGIIALDTGLGKTLAVSAAAIGYAKHGYNKRLFIFAPVNATGAWKPYLRKLEQHFGEVCVVSIDSLHKLNGLESEPGGVLIVDECHLTANENSGRTKDAHKLRRCFDVAMCLTGTLTTSSVEHGITTLDLAVPGAALFSSLWTAGDYFKCLVHKDVGIGRLVTEVAKPTGGHFEKFCAYLSRHAVSVKKHSSIAAEAGIPPQSTDLVTLAKPWRDLESLVVAVARQYMDENGGEVPHASWCRAQLRRLGLDAKVEWLHNLININAEPLVIAAWSKESLAMLRTLPFLESHVYVDGGVTGKDRQAAVKAFQTGKVRFYIGQVDASCVSVDLFRASTSVLVESTNRPANYEQFLGRTARRGQTRPCMHYDLVSNRYQDKLVRTVKAGRDFDASVAENLLINTILRRNSVVASRP